MKITVEVSGMSTFGGLGTGCVVFRGECPAAAVAFLVGILELHDLVEWMERAKSPLDLEVTLAELLAAAPLADASTGEGAGPTPSDVSEVHGRDAHATVASRAADVAAASVPAGCAESGVSQSVSAGRAISEVEEEEVTTETRRHGEEEEEVKPGKMWGKKRVRPSRAGGSGRVGGKVRYTEAACREMARLRVIEGLSLSQVRGHGDGFAMSDGSLGRPSDKKILDAVRAFRDEVEAEVTTETRRHGGEESEGVCGDAIEAVGDGWQPEHGEVVSEGVTTETQRHGEGEDEAEDPLITQAALGGASVRDRARRIYEVLMAGIDEIAASSAGDGVVHNPSVRRQVVVHLLSKQFGFSSALIAEFFGKSPAAVDSMLEWFGGHSRQEKADLALRLFERVREEVEGA